MKQKDDIANLFKNLEGQFDLKEAPEGHKQRFVEKLNASKQHRPSHSNWWKPLSIAATIAILLTAGFYGVYQQDNRTELAKVSPEMEKTQSFFVTTIHQEIEKLKSLQDGDTQKLVTDALARLETLEKDYDKLEADLIVSGNDQRVIAAMIANFQSRIDILERVITTIEEIKTLKANRNEATM